MEYKGSYSNVITKEQYLAVFQMVNNYAQHPACSCKRGMQVANICMKHDCPLN